MAEPLRILHLYPKEDYFTGAAIQLRELARGFRARGHHVVTLTRPSEVWRRAAREADLPYGTLSMRHGLDVASILGIARRVREERIQVVHCHKGRARTLALLAGLFAHIPVLVLNRGVSFPLRPWNRLGYTTHRVTAIVAVSQSIRRSLVAAGVPPQKIEVIYSGTDTERFHPGVDGSPVRAELGLEPDHFLVTQVGIRSWRGNDDVLDAMARVSRVAPQARLLFVGAPPPRIRTLREKARARGLEAATDVRGYREDVPEILAASNVTVDASYAGLGLTGSLRESLAVETPVIGTNAEGIPELILDGETGLLVPPRNPEALAQAILRIIENPTRGKAMARAGRKRVDTLFSTRVKVDRTEALYRRLLEAQR